MLTPQIADKGVTKHILRAFDLHASRRLGQKFRIAPGVVRAVVEAAEIENGDRVLEIGPGIGTLTQGLLEAGAEVTAAVPTWTACCFTASRLSYGSVIMTGFRFWSRSDWR